MRLFLLVSFLFFSACTNTSLKLLEERVDENMNGSLSAPADVNPAGTDSFSFLAMGDTHIGSPGGEVMKRIVGDGTTNGDSFALVAGDCSQGGLDGEFIQFKQVFATAGMPVFSAIGNHDIYFGGWNNYKGQIGRSIFSANADNLHLIFLDTANGVLGERQLEWLEGDLRQNTRPHVIIVTHFPPFAGHFQSLFKMSSEEETAILKDLAYRYGVDYVIGGHYHGYAETVLGNTRYIVTGGANDILDLGEKQNYVRFTVNGLNITHQRVDY